MTYKNAKIVLFAGLIAAMILPFSGMTIAEAESQKEKTLFEKFMTLAHKQKEIQTKLITAEHSGDEFNIDKLQKSIDTIQKKMDVLQYKYYDSIAMSDSEIRVLEENGLKVFNELSNPDSSLYLGVSPDGYFVSQISKKTHLIFEESISNTFSAVAKLQSNDNKGEFNGMAYSVGFPQKTSHFISCSDREDDCNYLMGGLAVEEGGETSTMSFWAKHDNGDIGFVMTAHGANAQGNTIDQYPTRDVGVVDVITSESWGECDCAFVDASETVVERVHYAANDADSITSYSTSNPSIGTWLQISGVSSGTIFGTYEGNHSIYGMMIDADTSGGDSGAPVTSIGSYITVYGMVHADGSSYTYATTYADIKSALDLQ